MPVKARKAKARRGYQPTAAEWSWLYDEPFPKDANFFDLLGLKHTGPEDLDRTRNRRPTLRDLWIEHRDAILERWVQARPGTRPSVWWLADAPRPPRRRYRGCYWVGKLPGLRERLGGVGVPKHEALNFMPCFRLGLPRYWVTSHDVELYGRRRDLVAIDPRDPPKYESQASYLERHDLFASGERELLGPEDFEPEVIRETE